MFWFRSLATVGVVGAVALGAWVRARRRAGRAKTPARRLSLWEKLVLAATGGSFVLLAATGFFSTLVLGQPMHGLHLMVHTALGGVFFAGLAALTLTWAEACRINDEDWRPSRRSRGARVAGRFTLGEKLFFWAFVFWGLIAILTMLCAMEPLLGTHGQLLLYKAHRASTLLMVMGGIVFGCAKV